MQCLIYSFTLRIQGIHPTAKNKGNNTLNIGSLLPRHARFRPDHVALIVNQQSLTFRELNLEVNKLANSLLAAGLTKGNKFATVLPNCLELMLAYWAAAKTGLVIVPCSTLLQEGGLITLLNDSDSMLVLTHHELERMMRNIRNEVPKIDSERWICVEGGASTSFCDYEKFIDAAPTSEPEDPEISDSDIYNIMYSSGTTGDPKGIVHTHYVRAMYCTLFASAWRMAPESVVLHAGAIVFNGAMLDLMPWMYLGCTYILHESFDASAVIREIKNKRVTHIIMVPAQIIAVLNHAEFDPATLKSLEMIQNVGAPLHLEYKKRLNDVLPNLFYELYGLTEGFVTILDKHDALRKVGSVGAPPAMFTMRILDDTGAVCAPGEIGEICGRGPIMMPGYYKRDDLTESTIVDGWLHTGDAGYVDEEGYLFLVDRLKEMIICGGVNVYPRDIEEIAVQHPDINEVAVFGVPDERWGEVPVLAVKPTANSPLEPLELVSWINQRVDAKFQRVADVVILHQFPRNAAGKTLKRTIRDQYLESNNSKC